MANSGVAIHGDRRMTETLKELAVRCTEEEQRPDGLDNRRRNNVILRKPDKILNLKLRQYMSILQQIPGAGFSQTASVRCSGQRWFYDSHKCGQFNKTGKKPRKSLESPFSSRKLKGV